MCRSSCRPQDNGGLRRRPVVGPPRTCMQPLASRTRLIVVAVMSLGLGSQLGLQFATRADIENYSRFKRFLPVRFCST